MSKKQTADIGTTSGKLPGRLWVNILLFGFMGQLAWNVENMCFNTFLYNSVYDNGALTGTITPTSAINIMVSVSAVVAVLTTFIMGTLSDKMRKRKVFISVGYIAWGIVTALFGFISRDNVAAITGLSDTTKILAITVWAVIVMDAIMTFMGSTSNDSAFNAWVTDITTTEARPKVELAFTVAGFVAMGVIIVANTLAQSDVFPYSVFFPLLGAFVCLCGVAGLFLLKDPEHKAVENTDSSYWSDLFYGFRPSVIKENANLYLCLAAVCFFNVAVQVFFPYIFVYLEHVILPENEGLDLFTAGSLIPIIIALIFLAVGIVMLMKLAGKNKLYALIPSAICFVIGSIGLSMTTNLVWMIVAIAPTVIGYLVLMIQLNSSIRDFTPEGKAGLFQGIRMIFVVLIPMVVGPTLGNIACAASGRTYTDEYGAIKSVPAPEMFLYSAIVGACILIPLLVLMKRGVFKKMHNA